jgi:hypothetical protein
MFTFDNECVLPVSEALMNEYRVPLYEEVRVAKRISMV